MRRFRSSRSVQLGDASPGGRMRLDALATYLQDVSNEDVEDAGLTEERWVVRRVHVDVARFPVYRERLSATTWCSGTGSRWAERRVSVTGELGGHAEAVTLWVCVDATTGRPAPLTARFHEVYGPSAEGRTVRARLQHDDPPPGVTPHPWPLRFSDFDVMGHVNNAAYWQIVEEQLARRRDLRAPLRAEMEFRGGVDVGDACEVVSVDSTASLSCWVLVDGDVRASALVVADSYERPWMAAPPEG